MELQIQHEESARRFHASVDGVDCELDYRLAGSVMTITHTGVPDAVGGRGIAGQLMKTALDTARERQWKVVPACSYAAAYMKRHPEYEDLRA